MEEKPEIYQIKVGIEFPDVGPDDVFEISLPLYKSEIDEVVEKTKKLTWVDNDLLGSELLEFSKSAHERAVKIAEETAVQIWGEKMLIKNGAEYGFFLPDEVNEAIYDSPDAIEEKNHRHHLQEVSKLRFRNDAKALNEEEAKGRWGERLLPEPRWNNNKIYGIWNSSGGERAALYSLNADLLFEDKRVKTSYEVIYRRDDIIIWIDVTPSSSTIEKLLNDFVIVKGKQYGHSNLKIKMVDYERFQTFRIIVTGVSQEADLNLYMSLLDELIKQ